MLLSFLFNSLLFPGIPFAFFFRLVNMNRCRGFRLGRRLVRLWRWLILRRRPKHYLRMDGASVSTAKSNLFPTWMMTTKLREWGSHLASRIRCGGAGIPHFRICGRRSGAGTPLLQEARKCVPPPKGHMVVYVGGEEEGAPPRRYTVPVIYFNHPLFAELLRDAEDEFGFHHPGGITIPCPTAKFELVRTRIAAAGQSLRLKSC